MSNAVVLDTSAVLALMLGEHGEKAVAGELPGALLGAVNLAEVVTKLVERGVPAERVHTDVLALGIDVMSFDAELAVLAGAMRPVTRTAGLSLGDRCCLALGRRRGAAVMTADAAWEGIAADVGVTVRNIRPRS